MHSLKPFERTYLRKATSGQHICLQWQVWVALMQAQFSFSIKQNHTLREALRDMRGGMAKGILLCYTQHSHSPLSLGEALVIHQTQCI